MEAVLQLQPRRANLLLHCGAHAVDRVIISAITTPQATATWTPLPHMALIEEVEQALNSNGLSVMNQAHSLTHDGLRYFGLMEIQNGVIHRDYAWVLGLRNSHDKSFPAGIVAGANVFICDNLSFSGEIKIARKHTRFILRDLPFLTQQAIGRLKGKALSLTPLYLETDERILGLVRLLMIGVRVLTLLEFSARQHLHQAGDKLAGIYPGNPKRATERPTTELMLRAFAGLTLTLMTEAQCTRAHVTPLAAVQQRILQLFGFSPDIYLRLSQHFSKPPLNLSEP